MKIRSDWSLNINKIHIFKDCINEYLLLGELLIQLYLPENIKQ